MPTDPQQPSLNACLSLIRNGRVMTVGTAGQDGAWTAPVYYLYDGGGFYFFSSPDARHVREGEEGDCGASIFHDSSMATELQGIQMTGKIHPFARGAKAVKIAAAYAVKYGISPTARDALAYFEQMFRAGLYGFFPHELYFMDNSRGFGTRELITL